MRQLIYFLLPLLLVSINTSAQKDSSETTVIRFFDGLSELSETRLRETTTPDFILLEDGEVWNIDTLIAKIEPMKKQRFKRVNKFSFITTEEKGDIAWVSYHNTAEFTVNDKVQTVNWLESAVLIKQSGVWKMKLLHSTRIK